MQFLKHSSSSLLKHWMQSLHNRNNTPQALLPIQHSLQCLSYEISTTINWITFFFISLSPRLDAICTWGKERDTSFKCILATKQFRSFVHKQAAPSLCSCFWRLPHISAHANQSYITSGTVPVIAQAAGTSQIALFPVTSPCISVAITPPLLERFCIYVLSFCSLQTARSFHHFFISTVKHIEGQISKSRC